MTWLFSTPKKSENAQDISIFQNTLCIRPPILADYEQWALVRGKNRDVLMPFEPKWPQNALSKEFFERRVEVLKSHAMSDKSYSYLIFDIAGDDLVGGININHVCRGAAQYASLGYWLDKNAQGKGYMTMAGLSVLNHAFSYLGLDRMNAAILPHNDKSKNLLVRLGFTQEGFAKNYIQINGRRQDHILFGMNKDDFNLSGVSGHM